MLSRLFIAFSLLLVPSIAMSTTVKIEGNSPLLTNCYPFGSLTSGGPYMGFVYQNIPAFALQPGDTIFGHADPVIGRKNSL